MKDLCSLLIAILSVAVCQNAFAQWRPTYGMDSEYSSQYEKWIAERSYRYSYDIAGNMTMMKNYTYEYDYEDSHVEGPFFEGQVEFTYDMENRMTGYVVKVIDDCGELVESGNCIIAYDGMDKNIVTSFKRTGEIYTIENYAPIAYERKITRDANGNITEILISGYINGKMTDVERVTMTYKDNKPVSFKEETKMAGYDEGDTNNDEIYIYDDWQLFMEITNIEWESTGNHFYLVIQDPYKGYEMLTKSISNPYNTIIEGADETNWLWLTSLVEGEYRIKSGNFKQMVYAFSVSGSISATYDSDGGYDVTLTAASGHLKDEIKKEYTDKNGSFEYNEIYDEYGDLDLYRLVEIKDEHGNTISSKVYDNDGEGGPLQIADSNETAYTYYEDTDEFTSIAWGDYKYVYSDFIDVTTQSGISSTTINENAPTSIFDMSGRQVGTSIDNLKSHKGVFIIKQGNSTRKVIIK